MQYIVQTALELGAIYALVSLALFLSFRILNIADMTTDGCFVLGAAVSVSCAAHGHPVAGVFAGMAAGGAAGFVTAFQQTRMGVPDILAGIITNTGLYTINLMAMGWSSNISLLKDETIFTLFRKTGIGGDWYPLVLAGAITGVMMILMRLFMSTRLGLSIRATGDNRDMVSASSIDPRYTVTVGLVVANMMTGLAGAVAGQFQKAADINSGTGIVVVGLACLIIGETVLNGKKSITRNIIAVLIGNIIYRFIYAIILRTGVIPVECLKLMTAIVVALAIAAPTLKKNYAYYMRARKES
jgi:putative ABC transport system permease protein